MPGPAVGQPPTTAVGLDAAGLRPAEVPGRGQKVLRRRRRRSQDVDASHEPYWGFTNTFVRWAKATSSSLTRSRLSVDWSSSLRHQGPGRREWHDRLAGDFEDGPLPAVGVLDGPMGSRRRPIADRRSCYFCVGESHPTGRRWPPSRSSDFDLAREENDAPAASSAGHLCGGRLSAGDGRHTQSTVNRDGFGRVVGGTAFAVRLAPRASSCSSKAWLADLVAARGRREARRAAAAPVQARCRRLGAQDGGEPFTDVGPGSQRAPPSRVCSRSGLAVARSADVSVRCLWPPHTAHQPMADVVGEHGGRHRSSQ